VLLFGVLYFAVRFMDRRSQRLLTDHPR
jgi:hypothetical protein